MRVTLLLIISLFSIAAIAQPASDVAIMPWAVINKTGDSITLKWTMATGTAPVYIYSKAPEDNDWVALVATLPANTLSYKFKAPAKLTEYKIRRDIVNGSNQVTNYCNGYIIPGIAVPEVTFNGKLLMVIEKTANDSLAKEIGETMRFISGDGWQVDSIVVDATLTPAKVKALIKKWYSKDPSNSKGLYLFGHVPVPYSGLMNSTQTPMDGHTPDHDGAWVADVYYAEMDATFTDFNSQTTPNRAANKNVASDGKFDQTFLPDYTELQVARVDLNNLPSFGMTETQLLRRYLNKIKAYKMGEWNVPRRGLIDDRLGIFGIEAPGRGAWMSLYPQVGADSVKTGKYFDVLKKDKYLIAHEVSTGGYTQYVNVGSVADYKDSVFSVFNSSFGSYFGDWDISDNIIRGTLGTPGYCLSNCWNGRPMFFYHAMGLGYSLGFSTWRTQNNRAETTGGVEPNPVLFACGGRMHISTLGDPTLRLHAMKPAKNVSVAPNLTNTQATINWTASTESGVVAYNIYRAHQWNGKFDLIKSRVTGTTYTDATPLQGLNIYMVRAVKLESSPSGTYYNQSIGITASLDNMNGLNTKQAAQLAPTVFPNPAKSTIEVQFPEQTGSYILTDISGKILLEGTVQNPTLNLSVENLTSGFYYLTYKNRSGSNSSTKIAVIH